MIKKNLILCITIICVSLLTACKVNISESNTSKGFSISISPHEIVEAIINKDKETLKGMFSEKAILLDKELDNELDYLLDSYSGEFIEYTQHNSGMEHTTGENEAIYVDPVSVFSTSEGYYKLTWNAVTYSKNHSDIVGIYSMQLEKWPDSGMNEGGKDMDIAGIITEENASAHEMTQNLLKIIYQKEYRANYKELFRELLSDASLATGITDEDIENFFNEAYLFGKLHFGDGWIDYSNGMTVCLKTQKNKYRENSQLICFTLDGDKIGYISIGDIKDDDDIKEYISKIEGKGIKIFK